MSYNRHAFKPYAKASPYFGTCEVCARREEGHDVSPEDLLEQVQVKARAAFYEIQHPTPEPVVHVAVEKGRWEQVVEVIDAAMVLVADWDSTDASKCWYCWGGTEHIGDCLWATLVEKVHAYEASGL